MSLKRKSKELIEIVSEHIALPYDIEFEISDYPILVNKLTLELRKIVKKNIELQKILKEKSTPFSLEYGCENPYCHNEGKNKVIVKRLCDECLEKVGINE